MNKVSPARRAAFEILLKIERERAFSSALLPQAEQRLAAKDKSLCHQITLGVLRKQLYLDRTVKEFSKTKIEKLDREVLVALRIGLFQIFFLDRIPAFSAINESVNLVHAAKKRSASGLVNAVLRRAAREGKIEFQFADDAERISIEQSHPRCLIEHWARAFGFEETEKLAFANNRTPPLVFRPAGNSDEKTVENLRKLDLEIRESKIAENAFLIDKPNEMLFAYAETGKIYFQDDSSQLVGEAVKLQSGEIFLDVCAAPGSKFTQIQFLRNGGDVNFKSESKIFAGDLHEHRLRQLRASAAKQGFENLNLTAYDAEKSLPFADETFDCILLDAPCSGTGTIRHNPEIRYFLAKTDFIELPAKQLKILRAASKAVKKGGRIVYSTCSLEREENEAVINEFLHGSAEFEKIMPDVAARFLTDENFAKTNPARDETDGFFIAVLRKK